MAESQKESGTLLLVTATETGDFLEEKEKHHGTSHDGNAGRNIGVKADGKIMAGHQ